MKTLGWILGCTLIALGSGGAAEPVGHAGLAVVHASATSQPAPAMFDKQSAPGDGKRLVCFARAESEKPCLVLLAAFNREDGKLANGWRPQVRVLRNADAVLLPASADAWDWSKSSAAFTVYLIFLDDGFPRVGELKKLVEQIQRTATDPEAETLAGQLHDRIKGWLAHNEWVKRAQEVVPLIDAVDSAAPVREVDVLHGVQLVPPEPVKKPADGAVLVRSAAPTDPVLGFGRSQLKKPHPKIEFSAEKPGVIIFEYTGGAGR